MIKKINKKIYYADGKDIVRIIVEIDGKKLWRQYGLDKGKVPKVAKTDLQLRVNELLNE